jgi:hypothetical protein
MAQSRRWASRRRVLRRCGGAGAGSRPRARRAAPPAQRASSTTPGTPPPLQLQRPQSSSGRFFPSPAAADPRIGSMAQGHTAGGRRARAGLDSAAGSRLGALSPPLGAGSVFPRPELISAAARSSASGLLLTRLRACQRRPAPILACQRIRRWQRWAGTAQRWISLLFFWGCDRLRRAGSLGDFGGSARAGDPSGSLPGGDGDVQPAHRRRFPWTRPQGTKALASRRWADVGAF